MNLIVMFVFLSIVNVVFSTVRSITTIKSGKTIASVISGGYFAFYNVMLIYTVMDFPMWEKCVITFCCNVIGVFTVKLIEQKMRKDRLWEIKMTVHKEYAEGIHNDLEKLDIPNNYILAGRHAIFHCYCETKKETDVVLNIGKAFNAKTFASETKLAP